MKEKLSGYNFDQLVKIQLKINIEDERYYLRKPTFFFKYDGWMYIPYFEHPRRITVEDILKVKIMKDGKVYNKPWILFSFSNGVKYRLDVETEEKAQKTFKELCYKHNLKPLSEELDEYNTK